MSEIELEVIETIEVQTEIVDERLIVRKKSNKRYINGVDLHNGLCTYYDACEANPNAEIPRYIGECLIQIATNLTTKYRFSSYCVDEETLALTQRGWLNYKEITVDDRILSYDKNDQDLKWSSIKSIFRAPYEGKMFKLKNKKIDSLVTPNHNFIVNNELKKVNDLNTQDQIILINGELNNTENSLYSDDFIKVVGWFVTEGHVNRYLKENGEYSYYNVLHQSPTANPENFHDIINSLKALSMEYQEEVWSKEIRDDVFYLKTKLSNDIMKCLVVDAHLLNEKILTMNFILSLNSSQRNILIETMIKGDGWNIKENFGYSQKSKLHIDMFLILCTLSGYYTNTKIIKQNTKFGLFEGYNIFLSNKSRNKKVKVEKIRMEGQKSQGGNWNNKENVPTEYYNGKIWCPETEYGTWICRREGKIYITGNTFKDEMVSDALEKMVEAVVQKKYDPSISQNPFAYFTQIAWNCCLQRAAKERRETYISHKMLDKMVFHDELTYEDEDHRKIHDMINDDLHTNIITEFEAPKIKYASVHKNLSYQANRDKKGRKVKTPELTAVVEAEVLAIYPDFHKLPEKTKPEVGELVSVSNNWVYKNIPLKS